MTQRSDIDWSRCSLSLVSLAVLSTLSGPSRALSFGAEQLSSSLGQPLSVSIPLLGATDDALEAGCFRLVTPSRSDGIATVTQARIELQTSAVPPRLLIRSPRPIDEPVIRIALEAGCNAFIRREYTLLLDPPAVKLPETVSAVQSVGAGNVGNVGNAAATVGASASPAGASADAAPGRAPSASSPTTASAAKASQRKASASQSSASPSESAKASQDKRDGDTPQQKKRAADPSDAEAKTKASAGGNGSGKKALDALSKRSAKAVETHDQLHVQAGATGGGGAAAVDAASLAALAIPRLKLSSELPSVPANPGALAAPGNELQLAIANERRTRLLEAPIDEDLAPRLEADLVVAKRRMAELQLQLGNAANAASGVGAATANKEDPKGAQGSTSPAKPSASGSSAGIDWLSWLWVPAALLVAGLVAFLVRQRRQKRLAPTFGETDPLTVVQAEIDEFDAVRPAAKVSNAPVPPTSTAVAEELPIEVKGGVGTAVADKASDSIAPFLATSTQRSATQATEKASQPPFPFRDSASHVDVSVLSHATDEAQVYADLGRTEQAITILRNHIRSLTGDRASPVPWLMIFDLFRRTDNRAGYDELAPQFRQRFNGRMPDWDSYGNELELDDGLEAFPHLVSRIERDWGKPEARTFLDELLYDNRGGSRLGFSLAAYHDLLLLLQVHDEVSSLPPSDLPDADWESRGANDNDGTPGWDLALDMIEPPKSGELDSFLKHAPKN